MIAGSIRRRSLPDRQNGPPIARSTATAMPTAALPYRHLYLPETHAIKPPLDGLGSVFGLPCTCSDYLLQAPIRRCGLLPLPYGCMDVRRCMLRELLTSSKLHVCNLKCWAYLSWHQIDMKESFQVSTRWALCTTIMVVALPFSERLNRGFDIVTLGIRKITSRL